MHATVRLMPVLYVVAPTVAASVTCWVVLDAVQSTRLVAPGARVAGANVQDALLVTPTVAAERFRA